jgi:predicted DNA binding protein
MIVEAKADLDILSGAVSESSDTTIRIETLDTGSDIPLRSVFWTRSDVPDAVEQAIETDPSVIECRRLAAFDDARHYRAHHPRETAIADLYEAAVVTDTLVLDAVRADESWRFKLWMPDRESVTTFRKVCEQAHIDLTVSSMYHDQPQPVGRLYGLTESQQEALLLAAEMGYFSIPRENSLTKLADELDLSSQAVSERLRRGMSALVDTTLVDRSPIDTIGVDQN